MTKFRSWNGRFKMFIYFENGFYQQGCGKWVATKNESFNWQNAEPGFIIKSKGLTVYVSDKIELHLGFGDYKKLVKGVLIISDNTPLIRADNGQTYFLSSLEDEIFEIIGNIHENKEIS